MAMRLDGWTKWVRRAVLWSAAVTAGCQGATDAVPEPAPAPEPAPPGTSTGQTPAPEQPTPTPTPPVEPEPVPPPVTAPGLDARRPWWRAAYYAGVNPGSLGVGDFNGDGVPDVVVGAKGDNYQGGYVSSRGSLRLLPGDGKGRLAAPSSLHELIGSTGRLAVGDVNADGRLDVMAGTRFSAQVFLGQGTGALVDVGSGRAVGLEASVNLGVWKGRDGRPVLWNLGVGDGWWGKRNAPRFVLAHLTQGPSFEQWEPLPADIRLRDDRAYDNPGLNAAVADFNEDGLLDAVFSHDQSATGSTEVSRVFLGDTSGRLVAGDALYPLRPFRRVLTTDFNRDGHADLLVLYPDARSMGVLLGTGQGTFSAVATLTLPESATEVAAVEWSGDGVLDVVALHEPLDSASLFRGKGDGGFTWSGALAVGRGPSAVAAADLDRDGRPELLVAERGDNAVSVYTAPEGFQAQPVLATVCSLGPAQGMPPAGPAARPVFQEQLERSVEQAVAGDFDSDGKMDVALSFYTGVVRVMSHEKNGQFARWDIEALRGRRLTQLVTGDFDGDGRTDIAGIFQPNGRDNPPYVPVIHWNDAGSSFTQVQELERFNDKVALLAEDFNGDGRTDLALAATGQTSGSATRLTSLGQRQFRADSLHGLNPSNEPSTQNLTQPLLAAGDFNGDGTRDLLHASTQGLNLNPTAKNGTTLPGFGFSSLRYPAFLFAVDADGDGTVDVLTKASLSNGSGGGLVLMRGDGYGSLRAPQLCSLPMAGELRAWKDLDGDGRDDALVLNGATLWALLRGTGGAWRALVPHEPEGDYPHSVQWVLPVDLMGDARPELVVHRSDGGLRIYSPPGT